MTKNKRLLKCFNSNETVLLNPSELSLWPNTLKIVPLYAKKGVKR